jgi:spore maturation protein CgeB
MLEPDWPGALTRAFAEPLALVFSFNAVGAVSVADSNPYLAEALVDGEEVVFHSIPDRATLPERIRALLAEDARLAAIAARGREKCRRLHTWSARATTILELAETASILRALGTTG